jgi:Uma2 family endonuclease
MAASATISKVRMSYEEYERWVDSHTHSEWVDGEVTVFMPAIPRHADIASFLITLLRYFVDLRQAGRVLVEPAEMKLREGGSYREPDIFFVSTQHLDRIDSRRLNGPADLVIEILSEDDPDRDRVEKYQEYVEAGIPEYWIVDGREGRSGVQLFARGLDGRYALIESDAEGRLRSRVLDGFWLDPAWLAADPLPSVVTCLQQIVPGVFLTEGARGAQGAEEKA